MKMKRFFAGLAAAALSAAMMAAPASASTITSTDFSYEGVEGGTHTFNKYLVMDSGVECPAAEFTYTVANGAAVTTYGNGEMEVYSGSKATGTPTVANVVFAAGDTKTNGAENDGITGNAGAGSVTEAYVRKDLIVDFRNVTFPEPGVYRFILTENTTFDNGVSLRSTPAARTLDVLVEDNQQNDHKLVVSSYVLYDREINTAFVKENTLGGGNKAGETSDTVHKTDGYVNQYKSHEITFSKNVEGNQASRDKYFKFTVTIENAPGAVITLDGDYVTNPTATSATVYTATVMATANGVDDLSGEGKPEGQQIVVPTSGTVTRDFYLQHGQEITLTGVPEGASYTITEDNEDYKPAIEITGDTQTGDSALDSGAAIDTAGEKNTYTDTYLKSDTAAVFTNDRTGTVPTGVILSIAAPCVIGVAVISGLVIMNIKKKKNESEE